MAGTRDPATPSPSREKVKGQHGLLQRPTTRATCWRSGCRPSNPLRPRGGGGGAPRIGAGPATCPSPSPRVAAPTTPRYLGEAGPGREGRGRGRRGQASGSQSAGRREGARAGSSRATQTHGPGRTLEPRRSSAFRCEGRQPPLLQTHPRPSRPRPPPPHHTAAPPPRGRARRRLPGSARRPSLPFSVLLSRATRFSSFSVNNSWVAAGGGKVAPAAFGRAPPTHPRAAVGAGGWRR